jgi:DNA-binding CsgD family transcriptional regulator
MRIDVLVASGCARPRLVDADLHGPDITGRRGQDRAETITLARRFSPASDGCGSRHAGQPDRGSRNRGATTTSPVLAFGVHETEQEVAVCSDSGVHGFVPRDATSAELLSCVRRTMQGEFVGSATVSALLLQHVARRTSPLAGAGLTSRELEIVRLLELGRSNKEIAAAVGIEVATVKNHVHRPLKRSSGELPERSRRQMAPQRTARLQRLGGPDRRLIGIRQVPHGTSAEST